jgi:sterol desaturase/sphingolipid hydroxylase (fatty acid hydroxylase superfamily)
MEIFDQLTTTAISFAFLVAVFLPMEKVFPAKAGQKFFRKSWMVDLCFFLGQYLLWGGLVIWALSYFGDWLEGLMPASFRQSVGNQPWWLQAIEVIVLSDFLIYWGHRLQHNVGFLWRFHKVHHSAEHLDWLAAHREHPLDSLYTIGIVNIPAFILGIPLEMLAGFIAFRGIWAIYIHSNVRLPLKFLRVLIGAPELHHWHHDRDRHAGNYANISPLMDIIFGTYTCPGHEPERYGITEPVPKNYLGQILEPMLPKFIVYKLGLIKKQQQEPPANNEQWTKTSLKTTTPAASSK